MITNLKLTLSELKQLWVELFLNKTDKVSDVGDDSVVNANAFGVAKIAQKAIKDVAIVEAKLFPSTAAGKYLDESADLFGVSERKDAVGSSTYIKIAADAGTQYVAATNKFKSNTGLTFELTEDFTMPANYDYDYVQIRSVDTGIKTNVESGSIVNISPQPNGHIACVNEYAATGGADYEDDDIFRVRIENNQNLLAKNTFSYYNQLFQEFDDRVLKIINMGRDDNGKTLFHIVTQNGASLSSQELDTLLESVSPYFSITDVNRFGESISISIDNAVYYEVNIDFRVNIDTVNYDTDEVRRNIQTSLTKALDFRFWKYGDKVEWDDLLNAVKFTEGVKYVPDAFFTPSTDLQVPYSQLPRIAGFVMRDLDGNILFNGASQLIPVFYPS